MLLDSKLFKTRPPKLKRLVRAYYEIKYNNGGNYIQDYDNITTIIQMRRFLITRGKINPAKYYPDVVIIRIFEATKKKNLNELEKDIGYKYF